jgi:hypothetical protein
MRKICGCLSSLSLISTILFVVLLILDTNSAGLQVTFEQVLTHAKQQTLLSRLAYVNVTILTLLVTALMGSLYELLRHRFQTWSIIAFVFIPVYCVLNLFSYFSQITIVPRLIELSIDPQYRALSDFLLRQLLQSWPDSAVSILNNGAYAILGIPSIIFGILLPEINRELRIAGIFLVLNGVACLVGIIGYAARSPVLSLGSLVGAVFFLGALAALSWFFLWKIEDKEPEA